VAGVLDGESLPAHLGPGEPRGETPEPAPEETGDYGVPVREPPPWRLNCRIGSGAFGTVFLEKVRARGAVFPELWAVKRISRHLQHFPTKQYRAEIRNLQALSNVSFVPNCTLITGIGPM